MKEKTQRLNQLIILQVSDITAFYCGFSIINRISEIALEPNIELNAGDDFIGLYFVMMVIIMLV